MIYAALAGVGVALAAGPLGCFVVWRRMAYFGDATAHAAILGVALALALDAPVIIGVLIVSLVMAVLIFAARGASLAMDTLLGVASHSALAIGLVAVAVAPGRRVNLEAYLFGDILSLTGLDVILIWIGALCVLAMLCWRWNSLLTTTLNRDLALAEGWKPDRESLILSLTLAVLVAVALKVVGALLITAMLIIPAAGARAVSSTPERMAVLAAVFGAVSVLAGLVISFEIDAPAGPAIVVVASFFFVIAQGRSAFRR